MSFVFSICAASLLFSNDLVIFSNLLFGLTTIFILSFYKEKLSRPTLPVILWTVTYLVRVLWLLVDHDPDYGLRWLDTCLPFIFYPIAMQWLAPSQRVVKFTLTFFFYCCQVFCLIVLVFSLLSICSIPISLKTWLSEIKNFYPLAYSWSNYDHPSYLAIIYLFTLPVGYYLKREYNNLSNIVLALSFIITGAAVLMTGARIGMIIFVLLSIFILIHRIARQRQIMAIGIMALMLAAGIIGIKYFHNGLAGRFQDPIREQLFKTAAYSIKQQPLLGIGAGGAVGVITDPETAKKLGYPSPTPVTYAHNQYLGEVMCFGLIGALALFAVLGYFICISVKREDLLMQALLLILIVFMFTEMPFASNKGINFSLFFLSLLYYGKNNRSHTHLQ